MEWTQNELQFFDKYQQEIEEKKFYLIYTKMAPALDSWTRFIQAIIKLGENPFEEGQRIIPQYYMTKVDDLASLGIPEGILEIQYCAFLDSTIRNFTLPKSLRILQDGAFRGTYLYGVNYKGTKEDWKKVVKSGGFDGAGLVPGFKIKCLDGEVEIGKRWI